MTTKDGQAVVSQPYHLTNTNGNITEADGTANSWSDLWSYQVPIGTTHYLLSEQTFSAYLEDTSPAEVGSATCQVAIEVRDPAGLDRRRVFGPTLYIKVRNFQDVTLKARLGVSGVVVPERYLIVIMARDDAAIDASDSYFDLYTAIVKKTLG